MSKLPELTFFEWTLEGLQLSVVLGQEENNRTGKYFYLDEVVHNVIHNFNNSINKSLS